MVVGVVNFVVVLFLIVADFFQVFQLGAAAPGFQLFDGRQPDAGGGGQLFLGDVLFQTGGFQPRVIQFYHTNLPIRQKGVTRKVITFIPLYHKSRKK